MHSINLNKLQVSKTIQVKKRRPIRTVTRANKDTGINWKYVEAVNGRAAMY